MKIVKQTLSVDEFIKQNTGKKFLFLRKESNTYNREVDKQIFNTIFKDSSLNGDFVIGWSTNINGENSCVFYNMDIDEDSITYKEIDYSKIRL